MEKFIGKATVVLICIFGIISIKAQTAPSGNSNFTLQPSSINKNVMNNAYRVEYWGGVGDDIVLSYEKAKKEIKDKAVLKEYLLDAIYKNEEQKKTLDEQISNKEKKINKLNKQLEAIKDKNSSKFQKNNDELIKENNLYVELIQKSIKNGKDSDKLQEEYKLLTGK